MSEASARVSPRYKSASPDPSDIERFWRKVEKLGTEAGCWLWIGGTHKGGYGRFWLQDTEMLAHRISFQIAFGYLSNEKMVLHHCDTPCCVNPAHFFIGNAQANMSDKMAKGRHVAVAGDEHSWRQRPEIVPKGIVHWNAVFTDEEVLEIRERRSNGERVCDLADEFRATRQTISAIALRKRWKHL